MIVLLFDIFRQKNIVFLSKIKGLFIGSIKFLIFKEN